MNAGDAGSGEQLGEAPFGGGSAEGYTVEQNLGSRCAEQETCFAGFIKRGAKFFPRSFELSRGAHVAKLVETRKLQQDVEAANKLARGGSGINSHGLAERVARYRSECPTTIRNTWTELNRLLLTIYSRLAEP